MNDFFSSWRVMVLPGLGIGAYSVNQIIDTHNIRSAKCLLQAGICVVVGLWVRFQTGKTWGVLGL